MGNMQNTMFYSPHFLWMWEVLKNIYRVRWPYTPHDKKMNSLAVPQNSEQSQTFFSLANGGIRQHREEASCSIYYLIWPF